MPKTIWIFFGLIATGKSTLAAAWAKHHHLPYYNSDRVRKELAGLSPTSRVEASLREGIYSPDFTRRTYSALLEHAEEEISAGSSVILDASYQERSERDRVRDLATRLEARTVFVHCTCSADVVRKRLEQRMQDPEAVSDGRWEIYQVQRDRFEAPDELDDDTLITLSAGPSVEKLLEKIDEIYVV